MKLAHRQLLKKTSLSAAAIAGLYASLGLLVTSQAAESPADPVALICALNPALAKLLQLVCGGGLPL